MDYRTLHEALEPYLEIIGRKVVGIETGCSWSWKEEELPYLSTPNIIRALIRPSNGKLFSLDNDLDKINICKQYLQQPFNDDAVESETRDGAYLADYVEFVHGDSVRSLAEMQMSVLRGTVNFVWFDSAEDGDHAFAEFMAVQSLLDRHRSHVICVDDFGSATSKKWQPICKALHAEGYKISTFNTPTGLLIGHKYLHA